jgi:hypothetical protein
MRVALFNSQGCVEIESSGGYQLVDPRGAPNRGFNLDRPRDVATLYYRITVTAPIECAGRAL